MDATVRRRLTFWLPLTAALIVVLAWLFRPEAVPVDLVTVSRGSLAVTVTDEGETRVRDVFVVSAPVPGFMRRIVLEVGDPVTASETVIARIEPSDPAFLDERTAAEARAAVDAAEAAQAFARAQVERAEAELEFAAVELRRITALAERDTVSESDLDAARRRARTATAALEEARATLRMRSSELQQARARLVSPTTPHRDVADCDCVSVRSPVSGRVLRLVKESEGVVESGTPLVEVGDPAALEIVVDLLSAEAVKVQPGQRVVIDAWGGSQPLSGVVRRVEPFGFTKVSALGIEEQRVNVIIDITDPHERWARLGHGYRVEPSIVLWEGDDVVKVPRSTLFRHGDGWAVFVAENGRAERREVDLGEGNGLEVEVRSGVAPGERLVLHPSERVSDGVRLEERS
jgi:HlyD family secretion protein